MKICKIEGCGKKAICRGMCNTHYIRWQRHKDPEHCEKVRNKGQICLHEGCNEPAQNLGYCSKHYQRFKKYGTTSDRVLKNQAHLSVRQRLELNVVVDEKGCWNWQKQKDKNGYGVLSVADKPYRAHRASYEEFVGPIEDDLHVLHKCDNPSCINPDHLFLGTNAENMVDKVSKGRHAFGEKAGHAKLTENQVREIKRRLQRSESPNTIVKDFPVTGKAVRLIRDGVNWKHVTI